MIIDKAYNINRLRTFFQELSNKIVLVKYFQPNLIYLDVIVNVKILNYSTTYYSFEKIYITSQEELLFYMPNLDFFFFFFESYA